MRLKIISVLLLIALLLNGCGNQSLPPSTTNDSVQKTSEKAEEKIEEKIEKEKKDEVLNFVFQNDNIIFPDGTLTDAKYHTLSTEGSIENDEVQNLMDSIEKVQIQENESDILIKDNSSYTGASILFSISNNETDYDIRVDLRDGNVCNLNVYSEGEDIKTYFMDSVNISDYIKKIVSYKVADFELIKKVQSIEFVQTFQSSNFVLSELESQKLIDAILKCEVIQADEINAGIPIVIKISENVYLNGKISPGGELVAIEQTVYDTSALEELKDHLKNIVK